MTFLPTARGVERVIAPAAAALSLTRVKEWLRIEHSDEDALLTRLATAAQEQAEAACGMALITCSYELSYEDSAPQRIRLPHGPVQGVTFVTVDEVSISDTHYRLSADKTQLVCEAALAGDVIVIRYVCGFGDAEDDVPADVRQAMLQHVTLMYGERESVLPPVASAAVYARYRGVRL